MTSSETLLMKQLLEQYFLLRSGKRAMTGKLKALDAKFTLPNSSLEIGEVAVGATKYPELRPLSSVSGKTMFMQTGVNIYDPDYNSPLLTFYNSVGGIPIGSEMGYIRYNVATYGGMYFQTIAGDMVFFPITGILRPFLNNFVSLGSPTHKWKEVNAKLFNVLNDVLRLPNSRPASPSAGDCRYDPATDTFEIYDGVGWNPH